MFNLFRHYLFNLCCVLRYLQVRVLQNEQEVKSIIKEVHEGLGESLESKSLSSHHGIKATLQHIRQRFYWRSMERDIEAFVKTCDSCQRVNPKLKQDAPDLHCVAIPKEIMQQIGVDISSLPESNGKKYIVVAVDYFSKWSEAKALDDKSAISVARFLFELICRFGCFAVQINDQGREFVNEVCAELHRLTGVEQRVTSAYHPQVPCSYAFRSL